MLIAIAVIGTAMVAAMAGLLTTVRESARTADRQQRSAALVAYGERLAALPYSPCADGTAYTDAYDSWPQRWVPPTGSAPDIASMRLSVSGVEYWDAASNAFATTCGAPDGGAQRLTIRATWRGSESSSDIVKRDPAARP